LFQSHSTELEVIPEAEYGEFLRGLDVVRANGFAANLGGTEEGISAIGIAVHNAAGECVGALTVAIPSGRFRRLYDDGLVQTLMSTVRQLELDITAHQEAGGLAAG
jgi:DNA-binding IclR family transcriptional regulator